MAKTRCFSQRGFSLITVLMLVGLLLAFATALAVRIRIDTLAQASFHTTPRNLAAAEAGVNHATAQFRNIFVSGNVPSGSSSSHTGDYALQSISLGSQPIRYQLTEPATNPTNKQLPLGLVPFGGLNTIQYSYSVTSAAPDLVNPSAQLRSEFQVNNIPIFQFAAFYAGTLEILPGAVMALHGRVHSNADLYLNSFDGVSLTIEDRPPSITTVQVSAGGNLYRGRLDSNSCTGTVTIDQLQDVNPNDGRLDPLDLACNGSTTRLVPQSEASNWLGSIRVNVPNIGLPANFSTARPSGSTAGGRYWQQADLRIVLDLTSQSFPAGTVNLFPIVVQDVSGNVNTVLTTVLQTFMATQRGKIFYNDVPYTANGTSGGTLCTSASTTCAVTDVVDRRRYRPNFAGSDDRFVYRRADDGANFDANWSAINDLRVTLGDYRRGGFYNNREAKWMYLLNVDVQALLAWNRAQPAGARLFDPNDVSDGGIVMFLSVVGPSSSGINNYGVRIFDSSNLGFDVTGANPSGLTVVSDQAIYVEGNYNNTVPALGPNGLSHAPAAMIGDSLNVLSQRWEASDGTSNYRNDQKSRAPMSARPAASTTIYSAFLGGVDTTTTGNYNGGLENFPRFHEDWSSAAGSPQPTLTYRGSLVNANLDPAQANRTNPLHVNGSWCGTGATCNIYNAPRRDWDFDATFTDVAQLPPLTPTFISVQQVVISEDFR